MYNRILVAIDGSDTSDRALTEAMNLAKECHSSLRLIHVVDLNVAYSDIASPNILDLQDALEAAGRNTIEKTSATVRAAGIRFDAKLATTDRLGQHIYDVIDEEATRWPADLVVAGTHGRRGIRRLLLGSVAEGLARISSKPLLLIRGE